ncbi:MAG: hypothetical protein ABUL68_00860, partial [Pseudomonadota bacterium]
MDFRVEQGGRVLCHLAVGRNLADLRTRTTAFAKACPAIACRPISWRKVDGWDYFATEFFAGESLETSLLGGRLSTDQALAALEKVTASLRQTLRPSTTEA